MKFNDFPGDERMRNTFISLIKEKELPHCILLTGEQGSGVFPMSLAIASALLCERNDGVACGECRRCEKYLNKYTHPDLHFTFPIFLPKNVKDPTCNMFREKWNEFITKTKFITAFKWLEFLQDNSKQGIIPVSELKDVLRFSSMQPFEDGPKVILVWNADVLGKQGNRLLKLIEEPPPNTYIILVAESEDNLLNTIRSRSQHYYFQKPSEESIERFLLKELVDKKPSDIKNAALLSNGNVALALELIDNDVVKQDSMLLPWLRDCYTANAEKLYNWTAVYGNFTREEQKAFWLNFLRYLKELQRINVGAETLPRLSAVDVQAAEKMSSVLDINSIRIIYEIINQSIYAIERNGRPDLSFLTASFRIHEVFRLK